MSELLTRDQFRSAVFERDGHKCVMCHAPAVDAHHIMERRLFPDGGYYLDNGASLCETHHRLAESNDISPTEIRELAGVTTVVLPKHLRGPEGEYDKWGNLFVEGQWMPGELFYDPSVQKILGDKVHEFAAYTKYPRTPHLPDSPGYTDEDINWTSASHMWGRNVVITEKMDGENTTFYRGYIHARSLGTMGYHPSRNWVKNIHGQISYDIPEGMRICGENLFAKHSLGYDDLSSYFQVFSIWLYDVCLSWDDTVEWCGLLGLNTVPVIYRGVCGPEWTERVQVDTDKCEGFVIRPEEAFHYSEFRNCVAKWVRPNHIQSDHHWIHKQVIPNKLRGN